jgi:O-acetyl-ADP-ribose deacetylase
VVRGNLLEEPVDAIVNAANGHLAHGGGVAAIIARAAGPELQSESELLVRNHGGPFPTGSAVVTTAGKLPFKGVIHAVGPRFGEGDEEAKLVQALRAAFGKAHERGWSVAFPAVSSGIFAVPLDICARAYLKAVRASALSKVRLCLRDQPVIDAVLRELK